MKVQIQEWYRAWLADHKDTDLIYAKVGGEPSLPQLHFIRDVLPNVLWSTWNASIDQHLNVIGEHTSKSVQLPVYLIEQPELGLKLVLRHNYFDWNVSVISEIPIESDLDLTGFEIAFGPNAKTDFKPGDFWGYCFFQGFPDEFKFGPWVLDNRKFSLSLGTNYELYTFVWLLTRYLRNHYRTE